MINYLLVITWLLTAAPQTAGFIEKEQRVRTYAEELNIKNRDVRELMAYAQERKVDFQLVYHLLKIETGGTFNHDLVGPPTPYGRAYGIGQFMENTAPWVARMADLPYHGREDLYDPVYSIKLTITYLHYLNYGGAGHEGYHNWHAALTAYNRGMQGLINFEQQTGSVQSTYSTRIMENDAATRVSTFGNKPKIEFLGY